MRCRKARSLLSAACSDELDGRRLAAVREHLASCPACQKEASYYTSVRQAVRELPRKALSEDFNTRLLNRIAQERFHETRTRAYLPKRAPRLSWITVAPVVAVMALALVVATSMYQTDPSWPTASSTPGIPGHMDDRYLTAQPVSNPNMAIGMSDDWSLRRQLARAERLEEISRYLTSQYGFGNTHLTSNRVNTGGLQPAMPQFYFQRQPVFRIYRVGGGTNDREDHRAY